MCHYNLIFAGIGGAQTSMRLQIGYRSDFINKAAWCPFSVTNIGQDAMLEKAVCIVDNSDSTTYGIIS